VYEGAKRGRVDRHPSTPGDGQEPVRDQWQYFAPSMTTAVPVH
jgi:hypothetical protein